MHFVFKLGFLLFCLTVSNGKDVHVVTNGDHNPLLIPRVEHSRAEEEQLKCNLKYCGAELLNFEKFSFSGLFRKMELASFCVKNCTPPVVHEFFQSIIYSIVKRIPGHCSGTECIDKNRFVALAHCVEDQAWPLLQCSKMLIDLAHIGLVQNPEDEKRNTTCRIVTETVQCIEESLQRCGESPFQLVKEILGDLISRGITTYCHPSYRNKGWFMIRTTGDPNAVTQSTVTEGPDYKHPQFVKGYRTGSANGYSNFSHLCVLFSIVFSFIVSVHSFS